MLLPASGAKRMMSLGRGQSTMLCRGAVLGYSPSPKHKGERKAVLGRARKVDFSTYHKTRLKSRK